jgi:hypothetical protein
MKTLRECTIDGLVRTEQIEKRINYIEKRNHEHYRAAAIREGCTVEEFKERLQSKVEEMVAESEFYRATYTEVLRDVLTGSGRFKSQFETGTSDGCNDPSVRSKQEFKLFGFPDNHEENCKQRPIYGYCSALQYGIITSNGEWPPTCSNSVRQYGNVTVKIKKNVALRRGTISFQDSLDQDENVTPTPISNPHFTSVNIKDIDSSTSVKDLGPSGKVSWMGNHGMGNYTEVQFHGALCASDIEAVYVSNTNRIPLFEIEEVRQMVEEYNSEHPENRIRFEEYP